MMWKKVCMIMCCVPVLAAGCGKTPESENDKSSPGQPVIAQDVEYGASDYTKIVAGNNTLGFQLMKHAEQDEDGNTFISPTSVYMALSMIYNGADGTTRDEIAKTLTVEGIETEDLDKANASLLSKIHRSNEDLVVNVSNALWLNDLYQFQTDFSKTREDYFNAKIENITIDDPTSADTINQWVQQATNDKIKSIVDAPLDPGTVALVINAIYFNGKWMYEFDSKETESGTFHLPGNQSKDIAFMSLTETLPYFDHKDFQAVSLPYGEKELNMNVLLPKDHTTLDELEGMLTQDTWNEWHDRFKDTDGRVNLPKFTVKYQTSLKKPLNTLGLTKAFDKSQADLSNMVEQDDQLFINDVIHKTYINVNEEGTEAAGVTSADIKTTSAGMDEPFQMDVNRPFIITITDEDTGAILFMGSVRNPQETD